MKKTMALLLLASLLLLTACQPTPSTEPVPNKGDNKMEEVINATPVPTEGGFIVPHLDVPEHWSYEMTVANSSRVVIDADILYSDIAHPVYLVRNLSGFDSEKLRALTELYIDAKNWKPRGTTREDLLKMLENAMRGEWTGEYDPDTGEKIYVPWPDSEEVIASMLAQLDALDQEPEWETMIDLDDIPNGTSYLSDGEKTAVVFKSDELFSLSEHYDEYWQSELMALQSEYAYFGDNVPTGPIPDPDMTKERAIERANEILKETGLDETFSVAYASKVRRSMDGEILGIGWDVTCLMKTAGVKMYNHNDYSYGGAPLSQQSNEFMAYRPSVFSQRLNLVLEDERIVSVKWEYPQEIVSVENPAVELLPFDMIKERIKNRIKYGLANMPGIKMDVYEIALTYIKAVKANDIDSFFWIPVWAVVFNSGHEEFENPMPVAPGIFFINAIDGTFIAFDFFYQG